MRATTKKIVLQIAGQPGAGKSDLSRHLHDAYGFMPVKISNLIREYAHPRGLPTENRSDMRTARGQMLAELGARVIVDRIFDTPSDLIAVDGLRMPAQVAMLRAERDRANGSKVIALDCPPEIRYARTKLRKGPFDTRTLEEFLQDEEAESHSTDPNDLSMATVMESADFHIDGSLPKVLVNAAADGIVVPILRLEGRLQGF